MAIEPDRTDELDQTLYKVLRVVFGIVRDNAGLPVSLSEVSDRLPSPLGTSLLKRSLTSLAGMGMLEGTADERWRMMDAGWRFVAGVSIDED